MHQVIEKVERMFRKYDIDVTTCIQKMVCSTVKTAAENVAKGNGSSAEKIFDGLSRWVSMSRTSCVNIGCLFTIENNFEWLQM